MENAANVKGPQASDNLNKDVPDLLFLDVSLPFLVVTDFLENITIISIFHNQTEARCRFVNKGISIRDDIRMVNRGQYTHLVQGVFFLFFRQREHFDILQSVDTWVILSLDLENRAVSSIAKFLDDCEV